jgi:hypothetical protein
VEDDSAESPKLRCSDDYPILVFPRQLWAGPENHSVDLETAFHCLLAESFRRWAKYLLKADCPHREWFLRRGEYRYSGVCQHPCRDESPY